MKKLLPYIPILFLIFGMTTVLMGNGTVGGLASSVLSDEEIQESSWYCTAPENFTKKNETEWCHDGTVQNIQKHKNTWNWQCKNGEEIKECTFTETKSYPIRGGAYFSQK